MKKFVSIVIALVMVLSMTSAFAWKVECETRTYGWNCDAEETYCGKGKIEVVPYVKVNSTACDAAGWSFVESECAAAVNSTEVNYAIKLTVDAYPSTDWWKAAGLKIEVDGITLPKATKYAAEYKPYGDVITAVLADDELYTEEQVYFLNAKGDAWINEEDDNFDLKDVVVTAKVLEAEEAEVCATLLSEDDGLGEYIWGDYYVFVAANAAHNSKTYDYLIAFADDEKDEVVYMGINKDVVVMIDNEDASAKFYSKVVTDFNLNACALGTCVGEDDIQNNFGWYDKLKDCLTWDTEASSTVNAECAVSVEIPKTGDVSVVAYAVMAIVAAAGTMLKK